MGKANGTGHDRTPVRGYRDLLVWQRAVALVKDVYLLTARLPDSERFGLVDQVRRAVVSVPCNIAEGQARQHTGEFRHFLYVALGSLAELDTQLTIAVELGYMSGQTLAPIDAQVAEVRKMLHGLVSKLAGQK